MLTGVWGLGVIQMHLKTRFFVMRMTAILQVSNSEQLIVICCSMVQKYKGNVMLIVDFLQLGKLNAYLYSKQLFAIFSQKCPTLS